MKQLLYTAAPCSAVLNHWRPSIEKRGSFIPGSASKKGSFDFLLALGMEIFVDRKGVFLKGRLVHHICPAS